MPIVPSVRMNASIPARVIRMPLTKPAASPVNSASAMPIRITGNPPPMLSVSMFITRIISPATKAAIDPTDRSSPPAVMTKVMPIAMMPMKADRASTLVMLA